MRMFRWMYLCGLVLTATMAAAQMGLDQVCEVNVTTPKQGGAKMFEDARKQHNKFHVAEKDKHPIMVWAVTTGPATGSYLTTTCGLTWKGMDGNEAMDQRDEADRQKTLSPAIGSNLAGYYIFLPNMSLAGSEAPGSTPPKMITIVHYYVKPGSVTQFTDAVRRINEAIKQTKYPVKPSRWYVLANGGDGPHYVLVTDRASWADMQGPEQSMVAMLKQAYGDNDKTLQDLRDALHHTMSEMAEYRTDLSYIPSK